MKKLHKSLLKNFTEFDNHKAVFEIDEPSSGLRGFIAIHRNGKNKPSFGATRFWHYSSMEKALADVLQLSRLMSYKAAMAGLPYKGAKGVIISPSSSIKTKDKRNILKAYAEQVNLLNGAFITGTDVGLNKQELKFMQKYSPFLVGLHSDPTKFTAIGLYLAIKTCLKEVFGSDEIKGHSFAIQGLGKIGMAILVLLYPHTTKIFASEIDRAKIKKAKKKFPKIKIVNKSRIHTQPVDVYSPCALSNILNLQTIPKLRCKIIVGGANNQLKNSRSGKLLYEQGMLYAPDYVVNSGGLISVVDEYEHKIYNRVRIQKMVEKIPNILKKVFLNSKKYNRPPHEIANEMAEKFFNTK